jgi:hypothetical protein
MFTPKITLQFIFHNKYIKIYIFKQLKKCKKK